MVEKKKQKTKEEVRKFVEMVAKKNNWYLHPDEEFLEMLIDGLQKNYNRYGYFACPCRLHEGVREKDEDVICPCVYCKPDIEEYGHCYCGLYTSEGFHKSGNKPEGIPERRPREKWLF